MTDTGHLPSTPAANALMGVGILIYLAGEVAVAFGLFSVAGAYQPELPSYGVLLGLLTIIAGFLGATLGSMIATYASDCLYNMRDALRFMPLKDLVPAARVQLLMHGLCVGGFCAIMGTICLFITPSIGLLSFVIGSALITLFCERRLYSVSEREAENRSFD